MQSPTEIPDGSVLLSTSFIALTAALVLSFVAAIYAAWRRTGATTASARRPAAIATTGAVVWLAITAGSAALGVLSFSAPPTMQILLLATLAIALLLGFSRVGSRLASGLPIALLVGFQGFRVVVELLLHRAYSEGLMPVQMSYAGRNFDIISGLSAIALGAWLATGRRSARLVGIWNALSFALLVNIIVVALLSAPTPLRVFMNEPANVWVTKAPWIWLPAVMVLAALLGHIVVLRYLLQARHESPVPSPSSRQARNLVVPLALVLFAACTNNDELTSPPPGAPAVGRLVGTVQLLGTEPVAGTGLHFSLYATLDDFEKRRAAHQASLTPATAPRTFEYHIDAVREGWYYARACFVFGCGDYRNPGTGELLTIRVNARTSTVLNLSF
ncbi:MAG: hypothetical protein AB1762_07725 [Gemmatimonadota bacterium]